MKVRNNILITGASSGLGMEMARQFAAKGRNLALCARRSERLGELKAELEERHSVQVAVRTLDVCDHDAVFEVFRAFDVELGGLGRVIVNAGIGKGKPLGTGYFWPTGKPPKPTSSPRWRSARRRWNCSGHAMPATWW